MRAGVAAAGCSALAGYAVSPATPPSVAVMDARLVGLGLPEQHLSVLLCVSDPNGAALRFRRVTATLDVSGAPLAAAVSDGAVALSGRNTTAVPLSVAVTLHDLGRQLLGVRQTGAIDDRVHGTVSLDGSLALGVPCSRAGRLDVLVGGLDLATAGADRTPSGCAGGLAAIAPGGPG